MPSVISGNHTCAWRLEHFNFEMLQRRNAAGVLPKSALFGRTKL